MIQIKQTLTRRLDKICEEHFQQLESEIRSNFHKLSIKQNDFISTHLKRIVTSKPSELMKVHDEYINEMTTGKNKIKNLKRGLGQVFNYHRFTNTYATWYCGYDLAKKLNVNTCPYCNRNYTVTVSSATGRVVRPDFDHFFPKKHYPLLALSFYNLIPCCLICNRTIKNQEKTVYNKYIHPYEEGFGTAAKFNFTPLDVDSAVGINRNYLISELLNSIEPNKAKRCKESFILFKLKEIYQESHGGEIADIVRKHVVSNGMYLEKMKNAFPGLGGIDELYRIAFGNFYHEDDFEKRPLSKLTRDVVEQLTFTLPVLPLKIK